MQANGDVNILHWYYLDTEGKIQGPFSSAQMDLWYESGFLSPDLLVRKDTEKEFYKLKLILTSTNYPNSFFKTNATSTFKSSTNQNLFNRSDHRFMRCPNGHVHRIKSEYLLSILMNKKLWPGKILDDEITDFPWTHVANLWPCVVAACPIDAISESANKTVDDMAEQNRRYESLLNKISLLENQISSLNVSSSTKNEPSKLNKRGVSPSKNFNKNCSFEQINDDSNVNVSNIFREKVRNFPHRAKTNYEADLQYMHGVSRQMIHITGQLLPNRASILTYRIPFLRPKIANDFFRNQRITQYPVIKIKFMNFDVEAIICFDLDKSIFNFHCSAVTPSGFVKYVDLSLESKLQTKRWIQHSNKILFFFNQSLFEINFEFMDTINVPPYFMAFWCRKPLLFFGIDFLEEYDVHWSGDYSHVFLKHKSGAMVTMNSSSFTVTLDSTDRRK